MEALAGGVAEAGAEPAEAGACSEGLQRRKGLGADVSHMVISLSINRDDAQVSSRPGHSGLLISCTNQKNLFLPDTF